MFNTDRTAQEVIPSTDYESLYRQAMVESRRRDEQLTLLSHEIRNPLNALATSAEVLNRAVPGSPPAIGAAAVIARQVRKLSALLDLRLPPTDALPEQANGVDACPRQQIEPIEPERFADLLGVETSSR